MADPVVIDLANPIEFGSKMITELTIQPLKAKHLRRLKASEDRSLAMMIELAGYLAGQPTQVIDELEGEDLHRVIGVVADFFGGGPQTGGES